MTERWHLEEISDLEGIAWNLIELQPDGKFKCVGQLYDERKAGEILAALRWQATLGEGRMSLAQEGITFDANTGKVWQPPKRRRGPELEIEPAKKRRKA